MSLGKGLCVGLIIVQRRPTECGLSECCLETSRMERPWPTGTVARYWVGVKLKFFSVHPKKAYRMRGGVALLILNLRIT